MLSYLLIFPLKKVTILSIPTSRTSIESSSFLFSLAGLHEQKRGTWGQTRGYDNTGNTCRSVSLLRRRSRASGARPSQRLPQTARTGSRAQGRWGGAPRAGSPWGQQGAPGAGPSRASAEDRGRSGPAATAAAMAPPPSRRAPRGRAGGRRPPAEGARPTGWQGISLEPHRGLHLRLKYWSCWHATLIFTSTQNYIKYKHFIISEFNNIA